MQPQSEYEKRIDRGRKALVLIMIVCGASLVIGANLRIATLAIAGGIGVVGCLIAALGFALEFLVRWLRMQNNRRLLPYQFSLAGMLILTTCVAVVCGIYSSLGPGGLALLVLAMLAFACLLELVHLQTLKYKDRDEKPPGDE